MDYFFPIYFFFRLINNDQSEETVMPGPPGTPSCPVDTGFEDTEFEDNILTALIYMKQLLLNQRQKQPAVYLLSSAFQKI